VKTLYFDNNATTRPAPEVIEAIQPFLSELWGNPSSMHVFGGGVRKYVEQAREQVAALIHAEPAEIVFTSCGTESDNTAILGAGTATDLKPNIINTRVEHPAVLGPCHELKDRGYNLIELNVDEVGQIDLAELDEALRLGPAVVSVMWANNETGTIFPIDEIARRVKAAGSLFHTDAVQAVGKLPIDVRRTPVDLLSLSGHKLHAPKGVGALYVRKGTRIKPFLLGGHQEDSRRAGTENVPFIVGLGRAAELARNGREEEQARVAALRNRLEAGLLQRCPDSSVNGDLAHRLPNTLNISFEYIEGEAILYSLSDLGIAASSGSACSSGSLEPSHVLRAMGVPFTRVHGSIRFSLSRYNTEEEVDYVIDRMPAIVNRLREMSPFVTRGG
jgi:cysteine desulfurase